MNNILTLKKLIRDKLNNQVFVLGKEIRNEEVLEEIDRCNEDIQNQHKVIKDADEKLAEKKKEEVNMSMADLVSINRKLFIKRYERDKLVALSQIQSREIRIIELEDEIERNKADMIKQNKIIEELDFNIKQQEELIEKESKAQRVLL